MRKDRTGTGVDAGRRERTRTFCRLGGWTDAFRLSGMSVTDPTGARSEVQHNCKMSEKVRGGLAYALASQCRGRSDPEWVYD